MRRLATLALAVTGLLGSALLPAQAGQSKSALQVFAENPDARFDPRVVVLRIDRMLARQQVLGQPAQVEITSPYLTDIQGDRGVDQQIRRLGELIRRHSQD